MTGRKEVTLNGRNGGGGEEKERRNDPGRLVYYNFTVGLRNAKRPAWPHTPSDVTEQGRLAAHCHIVIEHKGVV